MLDQYVSRKISKDRSASLDELTLEEVLTELPEVKAMFTGTAAFVGSEATLGEAKLAMNATRNCYDVFVTDTGQPQEPVLGWITDVTIAASEPA
jgi:hypothetical protein